MWRRIKKREADIVPLQLSHPGLSHSYLKFDNANNLSKVWEHSKIKKQVKK